MDSPPPTQRRALLSAERGSAVLLVLLAVAFVLLWWTRRGGWVHDPLPATSQAPAGYAESIDPNTAPWDALACLPGIGEQKARDIIALRRRHTGHGPAFTQPDDLLAIKGIGHKTVTTIAPFLVFPTSAPD